jgi:hypothetical protein
VSFDPVCTGNYGWQEFYQAYNEFASQRGGVPLFNQTPFLTRKQVQKAFGPERLKVFEGYRKRLDPEGRLLNRAFKELLGIEEEVGAGRSAEAIP